jgi:alkylglycerol monooxygenase
VLEVYMNFRYAKGFRAKWKVLFGKPDDLDPRYRSILERKLLNVRFQHRPATPAIRQYVTAQTVFSLVLLFVVILFEHYLGAAQLFLLSGFIIISLINSGAILDQRRWIFHLEYARFVLVMITIGVYYPNSWLLTGIFTALTLLTWYFRAVRRYYFRVLYT